MTKAISKHPRPEPRASVKLVRCAVYTRKSTEEGLEQEFNSLDAQREAGEAYVRSQAGEGWALLPDRYDDGGFTGGNSDRPALRRLMADIEAGRVDCVVVYKVDRLSRSLLDFAQMMRTFEDRQVSFVSVTQQFNTGTSMGRLVLNVLLSFAQFEREIISERTRDKIAATRRKGKWAGGHPVLGYDVDPNGFKLVVNTDEAERVRQIFALYLEHQALLPVVKALAERGWVGKRWATRKGPERGGETLTRTSLYRLLTNPVYVGKVKYKDEVHDGEHPAIVDPGVFSRTGALLRRNGTTGGAPLRGAFGSLLKGLLRCGPCGCAMSPTHTTKGARRYRYYACVAAQNRGRASCPTKSVPAEPIEQFVVDQVRGVGRDPAVLRGVLDQTRALHAERTAELETEERGLTKDLSAWHREATRLSVQLKPGEDNGGVVGRLAELHDRIGTVEGRVKQVRDQIKSVAGQLVDEGQATRALAAFDPVWGTLTPREQARVVGLLIEAVSFDGRTGAVAVTFRPAGITTLANELSQHTHEEDVA
ncbi:resolvase : Resolvase domain protein OS=Isosphaera pallida (strain ATCC 43644 / DSM 9630 / IS1B) GN=Isop_2455 PE=4 SV=1: Resolvase: Recombinase: Zn_ribbon_recom [Gemmataceae bacterium]|nr:resolvase : Resolvase domain protein OS=Isosphaera pallida (strain ATCC 43644 / DSM 9630 / IS1B) GN=Isop_2455 PE=4 SV=1: Resolvase: Recombinase: Zn_ribbon_recom [Gemmataceae bacterium]VTU02475.1 resolvase : Resolvase domain protein OS=Isosphaera pallida (strain ATCC 43644 / DSM 9630 / IS1B) GN=Isop_2455 PE=4 SV=1: Resolvase: Recombinase: Zn_ribbon_recom [Gemmataceae bacterium]